MYQDQTFHDPFKLFAACCLKQEDLTEMIAHKDLVNFRILTRPMTNSILGSGEETRSIAFARGNSPENIKFWDKLDKERHNITMSACYCSLLEECFTITQGQEMKEVESCEDDSM